MRQRDFEKHRARVTAHRRRHAPIGKVALPPGVPAYVPLPQKPGPKDGPPVTLPRVKWLERPDP